MAVNYPDRSMPRMDVLSSFRWSAIFAGLFAALATQILLSSIGAALGVTAGALAETEGAARGFGIGAGIWMIVSPLIAMFVGGFTAAWLSRPLERGVALMHGALVWCLSLVVGAFLVGTIATNAFSGVVGAIGDQPGISEQAATVGTGVAWASVLAMLLSLGSAVLGASTAYKKTTAPTLGPGRGIRREEERHIVTPTGTEVRTESRPGEEYRPDLH